MTELFTDGRIVNWILLLMLLEGVVLTALYLRTGRGVAPANLFFNLASGACLLLALRAFLTDGTWPQTALFLAAALATHVFDLRARWKAR